MQKQIFCVSEEHIGADTAPSEAKRVVNLLQAEGWPVVYGDRPWAFNSDEQRADFEKAFQWAFSVMQAEKRPNELDIPQLVKGRIEQNGRLSAHEQSLLAGRSWEGYWRWLLDAPIEVILNWLALEEKQKDVPNE